MPQNTPSTLCPTCGESITPNAPFGQCPRCLFGFASGTGLENGLPVGEFIEGGQMRRFAGYELIEEIARGGMGVVYRARQLALGREVALKMLASGDLASEEAVQRFRNEASAAASLDHPHIVPVYEIGEEETGHYFSMRFVPGRRNVADWAGALPAGGRSRSVALMMARIAHALAYAHERGVLHRDLKPSNLLIDENDEPQVTDFGLARLYREVDSGLTLTRQILGSPSYMAPEQAEGRRADETTLTDVYGLGAVLYEMLAGRPPFLAESPFATARKVVEEMPPRLPSVHRDLETICLKCLEKEPGRRYVSALALAEDLERFACGEPIRARPITVPESLWRWVKRRPGIAALLVAFFVTLLAGFGGVLGQWRNAEKAREEAAVFNTELQKTNTRLARTIGQLEWRRAVELLDDGDYSPGLAQLAGILRADPGNHRAASLAISVLEQRGFATPAAPALSHGVDFVITQARLSRDGNRIVTAGSDGTARLWEAATSKAVGTIMKHGGPVRWVEYSDDGLRVATASEDNTARVWDARSGAPLTPPLAHDGAVVMLAFHGERLATIAADGTARLWLGDREEQRLSLGGSGVAVAWSNGGDLLFTASAIGLKAWGIDGRERFSHPVGKLDGLAPSPDGKRLAAWSMKGLWMWDARTGEDGGVTFEEMSGLFAAAWSPDSTRIAGGASNNWARIWDAASGRALSPKLRHFYACSSVLFSADGKTLLSGGHDGATRRWEIATGTPATAPLLHRDAVIGSRFSADGSHLLVVNHPWNARATPRQGTAQLWDLRPRGRQPWRYRDPQGATASSVAWSPDGTMWATNSGGSELTLHAGGRASFIFPDSATEGRPRGLAFLPDGQHIFVIGTAGDLSVWSIRERRRTLGPLRIGAVESWSLSPDGRRVVIGHTSGEVAERDLSSGEVLSTLPSHRAPLNCVEISPDGRSVATAGEDGQCIVSDLATGEPLFPVIRADDEFVSVQYSRDARWIVTASHDHTARIWDAKTGAPRGPALRHDGEVAYAQFSPDGTLVLTADRSGAARLWSADTGEPHGEPMRHGTALRHAHFSPDGSRLVTEDHDGLRLWESATGEPLTLLQPHPAGIGIGFFSRGQQTVFSPDGRSVLKGTATPGYLRWDFPDPPTPAPAWLPELLEAIVGLTVAGSSSPVPEPFNRWLDLREALRAIPGEDFYARWARDYVGER